MNQRVIDYLARHAGERPTKVWLNPLVEEGPEGKPRCEVMVRFPWGDIPAAECDSLRRAKGVGLALSEACGCELDETGTGG